MTHNLTLLPEMDLIVVMESGRVAHMGTYHELLSKTRNLTNLLQAFSEQEKGKTQWKLSLWNSMPSHPESPLIMWFLTMHFSSLILLKLSRLIYFFRKETYMGTHHLKNNLLYDFFKQNVMPQDLFVHLWNERLDDL